ncbi:MAG: hypothetical protein LBI06_06965 [Treponema sp.]|jgi:tetratricopeptide (TPR) repeat protein|nr:hypothetical protein [Treponema sp.]
MKKINLPKIDLHQIPLLRLSLFSGIMLVLLIGGTLAAIFAVGGAIVRHAEQESTFYRLLKEYDFKSRQIFDEESIALRRRELERLDSDLDRLEKNAGGVENWLSILKRRRQLAKLDFRYEDPYRDSSRRAALAFPHSEAITAIAAAAFIHNSAITREGEDYLREVSPLLASPRFASMRLSLHVLLGDFRSPEQARASLPRDFAASEYVSVPRPETEVIFLNLIILKILAGDIPSATVDIQMALNAVETSASREWASAMIRLAAEYYYDFGSLLRSAELFSLLPDDEALSRQADALWLAGYTDNARAIWAMQATKSQSLYNYALTAPTAQEETALLQQLIHREPSGGADPSRIFGLIHLSRLLDVPQAIAVLGAEKTADPSLGALIALEILRRRTEIAELPRTVAETWLLLDRYPGNEDMFHWGTWYFDFQRNFAEGDKLSQIAARRNFEGYWKYLHGALQQIRWGRANAAEDMLAEVIAENGHWAAFANMGRLLETRRNPARALECYGRAMEGDIDWHTASRIQVRMALCLKTLGRIEESRRALDYAIELNPDNLTARLELSRL